MLAVHPVQFGTLIDPAFLELMFTRLHRSNNHLAGTRDSYCIIQVLGGPTLYPLGKIWRVARKFLFLNQSLCAATRKYMALRENKEDRCNMGTGLKMVALEGRCLGLGGSNIYLFLCWSAPSSPCLRRG